jgi:ParB/RepB/Spo0J family partition protein
MIDRIPIDRIDDNPFQTRSVYGTSPELTDSIQQMAKTRPETSGLIHVPTGRIVAGDRVLDPEEYGGALACLKDEPKARVQLAAGHRRLRAFRVLSQFDEQYVTLPVDVATFDDGAMATIAWEENAQREDISPIEEAQAMQRVIDELGWSQAQVGARWSLTQAAVSNKLRLLNLPAGAQRLVRKGLVTERHGRALLPLLELNTTESRMLDLLGANGKRPKEDDPESVRSVAQVEDAVKEHLESKTKRLSKAAWPADWTPAITNDAKVLRGTCSACDHRISRNSRCTDLRCYKAKEHLYTIQVAGPAKAAALHKGHEKWEALPGQPSGWWTCTACDRRASEMKSGEGHWYQPKRGYTTRICPSCWSRAELPEPKPEPEPAEPEELASAPVAGASGSGGHPGGTSPAPPKKLEMKKAEPPPPPPPPPATLVTARILPGDDGLATRPVMLAIAEEGRPPKTFKSGTYAELAELVTEICSEYFPGNTTGESTQEEVSQ